MNFGSAPWKKYCLIAAWTSESKKNEGELEFGPGHYLQDFLLFYREAPVGRSRNLDMLGASIRSGFRIYSINISVLSWPQKRFPRATKVGTP